MVNCPHCKFLSDPKSGNIYDARYPCPKCKKTIKEKRIEPNKVVCHPFAEYTGLSAASKGDKLLAALTAAGYVAIGVGLYIKGEDTEHLPWLVGSLSLPPAITYFSDQNWTGVTQLYNLAIIGLASYLSI